MTEPCWDGYEQIGMKNKNDKKVPNCVPIKRAKTLSTIEEQTAKIEAAALALVSDANFEFSGTRRVTDGAALEIVARSLTKNADEPFSIRQHRALTELSHYITLAQHNRVMTTAEHTDLLPIAHPRSTRLNGLTAAALLKARARWITDDPTIDDQGVKTLLASALTTHADSAERQYALARLQSFPEGQIPQYALVAAFEGYTPDERRENAEKQLRDRKGRFMFMGGSIRALVRRLDGQVRSLTGKNVGFDNANQEVHMELPDGRIIHVPASKVDNVQAIIPSKQSKDGFGDAVNVSSKDPVINEADLEFLDAPGAFQKDEAWSPDKEDADYYGNIDGEMFTNGLHDVVKVPNNQFAKDQFEMADQREREGQRVVATGDGENGELDPEKPVFILKRKGGDGRPFAVVQNWNAVQDFAEQDGPRMENNEQPNPARMSDLNQPKAEKKPKAVIPSEVTPDAEAPATPDAPEAEAPEAPQRKVKEQPKRLRDAFKKGFKEGFKGWKTAPEGFHDVNREDFEPQGAIEGQASPDFTDDPAELAQRFTPEQLQDALKNAVVGSKESPAPGFGQLPFEQGDEIVPADALFHAIKEQGGDADQILNDIYAPPKEKKAKATLPGDEEAKSAEELETPVAEAPTAEVPPLIEGLTPEEQRDFIDNGDYKSYLPENLEPEVVPEGYIALDNDPFDAEGAAIPEGAPAGFSSNPVDIALGYDKEDLKGALRRSIEPNNTMPGHGILGQEDENGEIFEAYVPAEAIRDALQLQGEDTNKLIDDIYKEGAEQPSAQEIADAVEGENVQEEPAEPAQPSAQDAQGPDADSAKAGLPADNAPSGVQGVEEAPEDRGAGTAPGVVAEGSQEADLAMGEPRREMVRAADLQPGDIAVRDNEFFVIEEVAAPADMSEGGQKDKGRNRINVKGYYPGHQTQDRDWFANGNIEVIRGVAAPAKGDGEALNKPKLEDYVGGPKEMKKIDGEWGAKDPAVQEKYAADLAAHKAAVQAAGADFVDPTKKEAEEGPVAKAVLADPMPAANAPFIAKFKAKDLQVGDISVKDHFRITNITEGENGKLLIEGHYPGQGLQTKQWKPDTRIEVIRGIPEDQAPQLGADSLHRPAGEGPKGGWFPVDDAALNAAHEERIAEAKARWNAPADLPVVTSNQAKGEDKLEDNIKLPPKPREPAYPAFMGKFADWAREAKGNWAEFKNKLAGQDIIVFDFETTGIDVKDGNEPWQIAAVKMRDGKIVDRINIFMNPGKSLKGTYAGENAKDPDGNLLTDEFFADKPTQAEGLQQFLDWAGANPLAVAQNAKFDDEVMKRKAAELGLTWEPSGMADTMGMAAEIFKDAPDAPDRKGLGVIAEFLGIKNENWHDGLNDAEVTAQAFTKLIDLAAEGNYGAGALDADAQQAAYDAKMAALQPRIDEFNKAAADYVAKKALKDGLAGKDVNLEAIQKEIPTPLPEGPIDNVGAMNNPEQAPKPEADLVDVAIMSAFPDGKMRIAEPGWADDSKNVEVLGRGDIHANSLRPGDFVHPKKDDPEFMQIVSIRGGEEFGVEEWKRRVVMQNPQGEQKVAIWNQNAFLDEVRRPKDRKALAGEPLPEVVRTPEEMNMQAVSVADGNAVLEIGPDGNEFVMKARLLDNEGNEIYAVEGRYLSPEAAEAEGKALLRRAGQERADQKRKNAGQPESKAKSVSIGIEPANVDQLPVIENVDNVEVGEGQNEITPRVEDGNIIYKSDAKLVDDGDVVAQVVEDFPNKQAASEGGRDNIDAMAVAFAEKFAQDREALLLRSEGRGRRNLPPIPAKYRRQVYIRALAGLYADRNGDPLAAGDKVIHVNPEKAREFGEGVVVRKVQGNNGGLQRKGVVYVDYVMVQYENEPAGQLRKHNARRLEHIDKKVAQERFDAEPKINWMNPEEKAQAVIERNKKPRKGGNEAIDAADAEVEEVVAEIEKAVAPEAAPVEAPAVAEPEPVAEPEAPAVAGDPFVELNDVKAVQAKLAELQALFPKFRGRGDKGARWAGREVERLIAELDVRPLEKADRYHLVDAIAWAKTIEDPAFKDKVLPELEKLRENIGLKKAEINQRRKDEVIAELKKPIDDNLIPAVANRVEVIAALEKFADNLPKDNNADIDRVLNRARDNIRYVISKLNGLGENDFDLINSSYLRDAIEYIRRGSLDADAQNVMADKLQKLNDVVVAKAAENRNVRQAKYIQRLNQPLAPDAFPKDATELNADRVKQALDAVIALLPTNEERDAEDDLWRAAANLREYRNRLNRNDPDEAARYELDHGIDALNRNSDPRQVEIAAQLDALRKLIIDNKAQFKDKRLEDYNNRLAQPFDDALVAGDPVDLNKDQLEKAVLAIQEKLPKPTEFGDVERNLYRAAEEAQRFLDNIQGIDSADEEAGVKGLDAALLQNIIRRLNESGNDLEKNNADYAQKLLDLLVEKQNLLKGEARDKFLVRRDLPLPEDIAPAEGREGKDDFINFAEELINRLPKDEDEDADARPIRALRKLREFRDDLKSAPDVLKTPQGNLNDAIENLKNANDEKYRELGQNLQDMQDFMNLRLMDRPIQPFAGVNLEEVDPIALAEERVANRENLFKPSPELNAEFADDTLFERERFLAPFKDDIQAFFDGNENPLAQLDMRARQALNQHVAASLKERNQNRTPEQMKELVALAVALHNERDVYQPQRTDVGPAGNRLMQFDPEKLMSAIKRSNGAGEIMVDGQGTGFKGKALGGGNANRDTTFIITDIATGQQFVFKRERSVKEARAEFETARIAAALGIGGRVHTELFPNNPAFLIQTMAGDALRLDAKPDQWNVVASRINDPAGRANMVDLAAAAILDAVINNTDRHGGNFLAAEADKVGVVGNGHEDVFLLPIDHGFAAGLNDGATHGLESAESFFLGGSGRSLGQINRDLATRLGAAAYKELMDMTIQQALQYLQRVNGGELRPNKLKMVIERLEELRGISAPKLERWAGKP